MKSLSLRARRGIGLWAGARETAARVVRIGVRGGSIGEQAKLGFNYRDSEQNSTFRKCFTLLPELTDDWTDSNRGQSVSLSKYGIHSRDNTLLPADQGTLWVSVFRWNCIFVRLGSLVMLLFLDYLKDSSYFIWQISTKYLYE